VRGTPEMSVIRMTMSISSKHAGDRGQIEYTVHFPEDVHIPGPSRSANEALKELGAKEVHFDSGGHSLHFVLDAHAKLQRACRVVANYLRWLHDFGGGVEFKHTCPHCGHGETFTL
jgi:hypothetical protein